MTWLRPQNLDQALEWMGAYRPKVVCGGTDLFVNWQRSRPELKPAHWLDVRRLPELQRIERTDTGIDIGAGVTAAEIWQHPQLTGLPALQQAARTVGGWQIQNRASLGGNLGNASPAADMIVPLYAYGALVNLAGPNGSRSLPVAEFIVGPRRTAMQEGELIVSVSIPASVVGVPQTFVRHDQRGATDISIVSAALVLSLEGAEIAWGRAAVGAASPAPFTLPELEEQWKGTLTAAKLSELAAQYASHSSPITDVRAGADYRKAMVKVYIERAAKSLLPVE